MGCDGFPARIDRLLENFYEVAIRRRPQVSESLEPLLMQFNSLDFLLFCAVFYALWPWLKRGNNRRWAFITVASFVFYGWWDSRFLLLLIGNGLLNFSTALAIVRWPSVRKFWLVVSLIGNLGSLAAFKYLNFFTANVNDAMTLLGIDAQLPTVSLLLPVGISFYTFQSMSYTIDVYRGDLKPTGNLLHFFAYLSMFPQLVAGPIVRAADLLPQLMSAPPVPEELKWRGTQLVVSGLFKKMVIADTVSQIVNHAFNSNDGHGCVFWWMAAMAFSVQIYCDFSGYSDIACGLANWMGYQFPVNFDHPYASCSLREFWQRWHISLSMWFRDYVYIPLGGSRHGSVRSHLNMWATMILSGVWHGANWTYVAWGALHALFLSIERLTYWPERLANRVGGRFVSAVITLVLVLFSWVFFRANHIEQAVSIVWQMLDLSTFSWTDLQTFNSRAVVFTGLFLLAELRYVVKWPDWTPAPVASRWQPVWTALILVSCVYLRGPGGAFIYFQF